LQYLLAGNCGELILITACIVAGLPMPLLPIHLLWINLVTDGLPALCLAIDPIDPDVMKRRPRPPGERLANKSFFGMMFFTGLLTAGVAFAVYIDGLNTEPLALARTHAFAALVFAELLRAFGARSETRPVWRIPLLTNLNLTIVVAISFAPLARLFKTTTLHWHDCLLLISVSLVPLCTLEAAKVLRSKRVIHEGA
jgi:Ca2+-transporting ATPase